jgi:hypothetical protein
MMEIRPCILCGERPRPKILSGMWVCACSCGRGVVRSDMLLVTRAWNEMADNEDMARESSENK